MRILVTLPEVCVVGGGAIVLLGLLSVVWRTFAGKSLRFLPCRLGILLLIVGAAIIVYGVRLEAARKVPMLIDDLAAVAPTPQN